METRIITTYHLIAFHEYLVREEKSAATVEKYVRDVKFFIDFIQNREVTKELAVSYKNALVEKNY